MSIKLEIKKIKDINIDSFRFVVPGYQRGYRWTAKEVERLLDDIPKEMDTTGKQNYCLQPIVVRNDGDGNLELIDGQQRLTTLYIIQMIISSRLDSRLAPKYSIEYVTRPGSEKYLKDIASNYNDPKSAICQDFWFMNQAAKTVDEYINASIKQEPEFTFLFQLLTKIENQLEVIWYEVANVSDKEAIDLFERLNIGKIPLTNSELVKALFLRQANGEFSKERAEEISLLWDQIEIQLNDKAFWGFLTAKNPKEYETRIDIVLDLVAKSSEGRKSDPLSTFFHFNSRIEEGESIGEIWREIFEAYMILLGWYENIDHKVFHLVSFLISSGLMPLSKIYALLYEKAEQKEEGKPRRLGNVAFRKKLAQQIIDKLYGAMSEDYKSEICSSEGNPEEKLGIIADPDHLSFYSYEETEDKQFIHYILLLYNILGEMNADDGRRMFPIARHIEEKWTLEHIHARHSAMLSTNSQIINWLETHIPLMRELDKEYAPGIEARIVEMETLLRDMKSNSQTPRTRERYREIYEAVWPLFNNNKTEIHNLSNLTLLSPGQNSSVSNYVFKAKRDMVVRWDAKGNYVPWCTRRVFFKNFPNLNSNQIDFWSKIDQENYLKDISDTLKTLSLCL